MARHAAIPYPDLLHFTTLPFFHMICGTWYLSGKFGALRPQGRSFESHSSLHVGTLGKSFTHSCLIIPTQYQCFSRERL